MLIVVRNAVWLSLVVSMEKKEKSHPAGNSKPSYQCKNNN
jgi:hypothetical protein